MDNNTQMISEMQNVIDFVDSIIREYIREYDDKQKKKSEIEEATKKAMEEWDDDVKKYMQELEDEWNKKQFEYDMQMFLDKLEKSDNSENYWADG